MRRESMRKYSLLGLVLIGASAVTAAVLPKDNNKKQNMGCLILTGAGDNQLTCALLGTCNGCTFTAGTGTRTTENKLGTSSITVVPGQPKVKSITQAINSLGAQAIVNNIHTSQDGAAGEIDGQ